MNQQTTEAIKKAEEQFSIWRATRQHSEAIPDHLWHLAYEVAKHIGDSKACALLRLNHTRFKERRPQKLGSSRNRQEFIEVSSPPIPYPSGEVVLEMESPSGKLIIRLLNAEADYLAKLARMLLVRL